MVPSYNLMASRPAGLHHQRAGGALGRNWKVAGPAAFLPCVAAAPRRVQASTARIELRNDGVVPCTTLRLRRASIAVRVLDDEGRAVQDPVVQVGLSQKGRRRSRRRAWGQWH